MSSYSEYIFNSQKTESTEYTVTGQAAFTVNKDVATTDVEGLSEDGTVVSTTDFSGAASTNWTAAISDFFFGSFQLFHYTVRHFYSAHKRNFFSVSSVTVRAPGNNQIQFFSHI